VAEPVTLEELRHQTRVDADDEDALLTSLISSARRAIENRTDRTIVGETPTMAPEDMPVVRQAILMLAAHWYVNRDLGTNRAPDIPVSVEYLIGPVSRMAV
jgi:uncharacterized phage protein (predicted DNA packaging)